MFYNPKPKNGLDLNIFKYFKTFSLHILMLQCRKCNAVFKNGFRLEQHLNKPLSCGIEYDCSLCSMTFGYRSSYLRHLKSKKHVRNVQNVHDFVQNVHDDVQNVHYLYKCDKCSKTFGRKSRKDEHQGKCRGVSDPLQCPRCLKVFASRQSKSNHCKNVKCEIKPSTPSMTSQLQSQNVYIINNNTYNNNFHVHINAFKNENVDYIDVNKMNNYICSALPGFQKLIKEIHFNENHPENKNVRIKNIRSSLAEYFNGEKWVYENKKVVVEDLVNMCMERIYQFLQTDNATENAHKCYEHLNEWLESTDENIKTYEKLRNDTLYTIANNSK